MKDNRTLSLPQRIAAALAALALAFSFALPATGCTVSIGDNAAGSGSSISSSDGSADTYGDLGDARSAQATIADIPTYTGALCIDINHGMPGVYGAGRGARDVYAVQRTLDFERSLRHRFRTHRTRHRIQREARRHFAGTPKRVGARKYSFVDDGHAVQPRHLIAHQLCGENANEKNLITGTRTFNAVGMLYYEELVGDYVRSTGNHVLYRVTPLFAANDLVARGVQMEAKSVEDNGEAVQFNVFVYNVEPA